MATSEKKYAGIPLDAITRFQAWIPESVSSIAFKNLHPEGRSLAPAPSIYVTIEKHRSRRAQAQSLPRFSFFSTALVGIERIEGECARHAP